MTDVDDAIQNPLNPSAGFLQTVNIGFIFPYYKMNVTRVRIDPNGGCLPPSMCHPDIPPLSRFCLLRLVAHERWQRSVLQQHFWLCF